MWLGCPLRRRRRASGRAATTRRRRGGGRLPPRPDATAHRTRQPSAARAAPGRTGLPASCGTGKAGRRQVRPNYSPQIAPFKFGLYLNEKKIRVSQSEDCSETPGTPRPGGRRLAQILDSQFTLAVAELIRARSSLSARRAAKSFKIWVAPHPLDKNGG